MFKPWKTGRVTEESAMSNHHSKLKTKTMSMTSIFLVAAILVFINILSYRMFFRVDLTERKEYTISDATKNLLHELDDIINITAYFSKELPPYHSTIRTQVKDILAEYQAFSNNNLKIQYIDPGKDEDMKMRLARMGIPEIPLGEIKRDRQVIRMGYMGIAIQYGDRGEVIPFVPNVGNLEYDLTSAILKVQDESDRIIVWVGSQASDEQDPNSYTVLHEELNKNYIVRTMTPDTLTDVPSRTSILVVDGSQKLPPRAMYAIDQYLMQNGNVIFLTDGIRIHQEQGLAAISADQSIHSLLEHYGITADESIVADRRNAMAMFSSGRVRFRVPYPLWPMIGSEGFHPDIPAVSQLESLVLPWSSPLVFHSETSPGLEQSDLVKTSDVSWRMESPYDLNPQQNWDITEADLVQSVLAMECRGPLQSFFTEQPIPEPAPEPGQSFSATPDEKEKITSAQNARFLVIASTRFVNNQFLSMHGENMIFFQNIIDSMALGDYLIGIRSRIVSHRPLDFGTTDENDIESIKTTHRILGIALMPFTIIMFGLIRMMIRNRKKAYLQSKGA
jgi:ABC-2 type transport system permease protein